MSKAGYRESTIRSTVAALKAIEKRTDLLDAEQAKVCLANALYLVAVNKNPALGPSISVEYSIKISWSERSYASLRRTGSGYDLQWPWICASHVFCGNKIRAKAVEGKAK